jgi:response regulator RpfG family c-di-GMP phosphodiesterase
MAAPTEARQTENAQISTDALPTQKAWPARLLLEDLLRRPLIPREAWDAIQPTLQEKLRLTAESDKLLDELVQHKLLTEYQAGRVRAGKTASLILGNYRILDRIGAGGMGVVYKAEHRFLRRLVALKVLPCPLDDDPHIVDRFLAEIRHVAGLKHPNIVAALDAGMIQNSDPETPNAYYLVMEYAPGDNLDRYVRSRGPLSPAKACDLVCQIASALAEAHEDHLVHRDIKPSNILVTPEGQAKLLDFGLARRTLDRHLTDPGTVLGSLDYMAPEQAGATGAVDHRADIYALGGILCWCLTGKAPFPAHSTLIEELLARQIQAPPSLHLLRPELPPELDAVVARMMALRPEDRPPSAKAAMSALLPFLSPDISELKAEMAPGLRAPYANSQLPNAARVLIVDDEAVGRFLCRRILEGEGISCDEVVNGRLALEAVYTKRYDLLMLDIQMPEMKGPEVLRRIREQPPCPNLKVIMLSGLISPDEMAELLAAGADDYLPKPPSIPQLVGRVKAALTLKAAQDRTDLLNRNLHAVNAELEKNLRSGASDLIESRNALLLSLAELAELRTGRPGSSLLRLQRCSRLLAEEAASHAAFAGQIDANFIATLECSAPLHDLGMAALPDHIIRKAGKLDHDERLVMQSHTTIGADILQGIARRHRSALTILQMAAEVARHHHEAYDGSGYPDRLAGSAIPLSARIVAFADVYDALRSRRPQRPPLAHVFAMELMTEGSSGRFDPHLMQAFQRCAPQFDRIFREVPDGA